MMFPTTEIKSFRVKIDRTSRATLRDPTPQPSRHPPHIRRLMSYRWPNCGTMRTLGQFRLRSTYTRLKLGDRLEPQLSSPTMLTMGRSSIGPAHVFELAITGKWRTWVTTSTSPRFRRSNSSLPHRAGTLQRRESPPLNTLVILYRT